MNLEFWKKHVETNVDPACIVAVGPDGKTIHYHTTKAILETLTPPTGDGVYKADGSPDFATFRWDKPKDKNGFMHLTFAVAIPINGVLVDIPNNHNILVAVKAAFETIQLDCMLKFDQVPYTNPDCADITIGFNDGSDPMFVSDPAAIARTYYPGTKPQGVFSSLYNYKYLLALTNGPDFAMDFNQILRHELRHGIGAVHTTNSNDIMFPFYHEVRRPTPMDVYQDQLSYGPRTPPVNPIEVDGFYSLDSRNIEFS